MGKHIDELGDKLHEMKDRVEEKAHDVNDDFQERLDHEKTEREARDTPADQEDMLSYGSSDYSDRDQY